MFGTVLHLVRQPSFEIISNFLLYSYMPVNYRFSKILSHIVSATVLTMHLFVIKKNINRKLLNVQLYSPDILSFDFNGEE